MSSDPRWVRSAATTALAGTAGYILAAVADVGASMPPFLAVLYVIAFGAVVGYLVPSLVDELRRSADMPARKPAGKQTDEGNIS